MATGEEAGSQARPTGWTAWGATWLSMLAACLAAVIVLAVLSASTTETALERALADHLSSQAQLVGVAVGELKIPLVAALGGEHSIPRIQERLRELEGAAQLNDLAVLGPELRVFSRAEATSWLTELAEQDLIARAAGGETLAGPLYRGRDDALYMTAYAPLPKAKGWVVAVEGSASSLAAVAELERLQLWAGAVVLLGAGLFGAVLARLLVRPIRRLEAELSLVSPGDAPGRISRQGPREMRGVVDAARRLLVAIRSRDEEIAQAHQREVEQITRLAAEVAHEVRNPLNAMSLSVQRLGSVPDGERRDRLIHRVSGQIEQLDRIVCRLADLSRPLQPERDGVNLDALADGVAEEIRQLGPEVEVTGPPLGEGITDRVMVAEVVRNLCLNAQQAGARRIVLARGRGEGSFTLTVSDDGPGIPEGEVGELFAWFHTTRATGSGLGLPTSRRMAEALGGSLELVSPRPASFCLTLPEEGA